MVRRFVLVVVGGLAVVSLSWLAAVPSTADDDRAQEREAGASGPAQEDKADKPTARERARKALMRSKLAASQHLLEGLAVEDWSRGAAR